MKTRCAPELSLLLSIATVLASLGTPLFAQSTLVQHSYPGLTLTGTASTSVGLRYVDVLVSTANTWFILTNFSLPQSPYLVVDSSTPDVTHRFYEVSNATIASLQQYIGLTISGNPGSTNLIQYIDTNGDTNAWKLLTNIVLPTNPSFLVDTISPAGARRRYRAEDLARPPVINSPNLVLAQLGSAFSYQITATSYLAVTSYGASGLPAGLAIDTSSGLISGTPTGVGTNNVTISATNSTGPGSLSLTIATRLSFATELVSISAGSFIEGSPNSEVGRSDNEGPQTSVTLTHGFFLGKYEVSQAEYQAVVGANPSSSTSDLTRPVDGVTWNDATNFCALLTDRDRTSGRITASSSYRLPTEAEWEYAARAGTTTRYSFGDDETNLPLYAWFSDNSASVSHPVGQKLPNPWGLYDMGGNGWEFCSDWYGIYSGGSATDPQGPASGTFRVYRGGSWSTDAQFCRSATRSGVVPNSHFIDLGFRILLVTGP